MAYSQGKGAERSTSQLEDGSGKSEGATSISQSIRHEPAESTSSRASLIEQAKQFLEEDDVKYAPAEKKIAFLESKGLHNTEIQTLLGISRMPQPAEDSNSETPSELPNSHSEPKTRSFYPQAEALPPIIIYPEFLTKSSLPKPVITAPRLLKICSIFGSLALLLRGTKDYLIQPMLASLIISRLSLASTAQSNLRNLLSLLEATVSTIPPHTSLVSHSTPSEAGSDPAELFHRDIGVQTSLPTSPVASHPPSPSPQNSTDPLHNQTTSFAHINTFLSNLVTASISESQDVSELQITINLLKEYCNSLAYTQPARRTWGVYGNAGNEENDDEVERLKRGIRGVKGVLLSARNFPSGR